MCVLPYVLELKNRTLFLNTHWSEISAYFKSLRRGRRPSHCATSRAYADKNYIYSCLSNTYLPEYQNLRQTETCERLGASDKYATPLYILHAIVCTTDG